MLKYKKSGDSAFIIKAGDEISEEINLTVRKLLLSVEREKIEGILDFIPSYNELLVIFDPLRIETQLLLQRLHDCEKQFADAELPQSSVFTIPVCYGGKYGPDLPEVAQHAGLAEDEVISIHSSGNYKVFMLGFTPGFCYLGGLDKKISVPRKKNPRIIIDAGSVGIAEDQTGIYPIQSPGGWQLIGKTPLKLFDPVRKPEFLVNAGDYINFRQVEEDEFLEITQAIDKGTYYIEVKDKE
jgi:inhibitor of KinA